MRGCLIYMPIKKNKIWHLDQRVKILRLEREDIEEGIEPEKLQDEDCCYFKFLFLFLGN